MDPHQLPEQPNLGGNLVDSILQSFQTGVPGAGDGSMPIGPVSNEFGLLPQSAPLSEFSRARHAILDEHIPRVERLARNVIAGIARAYEPGIHPGRTADDVQALRDAVNALRDILHDSGIGAMPIDASQLVAPLSENMGDPSQMQGESTAIDEKRALKRVEEVFARVQRRKDAAGVAVNILTH